MVPTEPSPAPGWLQLGRGRWKRALIAFDRQRTSTAHEESMRQVGRSVALVKLGREDEAFGALNDAVSADPDNPAAVHERGLWRARTGDVDNATIDLRRAVDLRPDGESLRDLGGVFAAQGLFEDAIAMLERALGYQNVPLGDVATNLAICHHHRGAPLAAARVLDQAIWSDIRLTEDERVSTMLSFRTRLLRAADQQGILPEAIMAVFEADSVDDLRCVVEGAPFLPTELCIDLMESRARAMPELQAMVAQRVEVLRAGWLVVRFSGDAAPRGPGKSWSCKAKKRFSMSSTLAARKPPTPARETFTNNSLDNMASPIRRRPAPTSLSLN